MLKNKFRHIIFHSNLYERPETLVKTNSIADIKNMSEAYYKDTRITLIEEVLVPFLTLTLNLI